MTSWIRTAALNCLVLCVLLVALAGAAQAEQNQPPDVSRTALTRDGQTIEVMPLDAWENPYRGQYGEWDYWIWEHFDPTITFLEAAT